MKEVKKIIQEVLEIAFKKDENVYLDFENKEIKIGDLVIGEFYMYSRKQRPEFLSLNSIEIFPEFRKKGYGKKALEEIIDYANENNKIIELTPESYRSGGMSTNQLKKWYKGFGFVENKGTYKDFGTMASMFKFPNSLKESDWPQSSMKQTVASNFPGFPNPKDYDQFGNRLDDIKR